MICGVEDQEEQERAVQMRQEPGGQRAAMHGHRRRCRIIPIRRRSAADSLDIQPDDERSEVERKRDKGRTTSGNLRGARATRLDHPLDEDDGRRRDLIGRPDLCRQVQNDRKGGCPPCFGKSVPLSQVRYRLRYGNVPFGLGGRNIAFGYCGMTFMNVYKYLSDFLNTCDIVDYG
ncbi:hypothetical protein NPIL_45711 [Nephila pilipes]|uniref:Uncharacterized protein n=1 Tax=Nephila pilipes TaxID=299642 RepID=A0A8X6R4E0_NEPPI|nr:hypothetical protein NPIL_45711 [Nephila pilipes]